MRSVASTGFRTIQQLFREAWALRVGAFTSISSTSCHDLELFWWVRSTDEACIWVVGSEEHSASVCASQCWRYNEMGQCPPHCPALERFEIAPIWETGVCMETVRFLEKFDVFNAHVCLGICHFETTIKDYNSLSLWEINVPWKTEEEERKEWEWIQFLCGWEVLIFLMYVWEEQNSRQYSINNNQPLRTEKTKTERRGSGVHQNTLVISTGHWSECCP